MKKSTCHQKDVSLEIMRIIAIFFVIFNHTEDKGFALGFMTIKPILEVIISCELNNSFGFLSVDFLVYPLLGYFLCNFIDYGAISGKKIALSWIINIILILISCFFVFYRMRKTGEVTEGNSQQFHNMFVLVNASVIFVTIKKYLKVNKHKKISTGALLVGECVFGVYLFHIFVMRLEFVGAIYKVVPLSRPRLEKNA